MIDKPETGQEKTAKLLIMDNGPISTLSNIDGALDWFFVPGCEVLITDMVLIEARKPPKPGASPRKAARASFEDWLSRWLRQTLEKITRTASRYGGAQK